MNSITESGIQVKIFVGFEISLEIRMALNQSREWKKAIVVKDQSNNAVGEVHYNEKDYLGRHLVAKMLTIKDLRTEAVNIRERLKEFCPEINVDAIKICIFPQVFVS